MKKTVIIGLVIAVILFIGIRAYLNKDYVTVLKFEEENSVFFVSPDSVTVAPYFYVDNSTTLVAVINFNTITDSILIDSLDVGLYSIDNPDQSISQKYVQTTVHPVVPGNGGILDMLKADSFYDLPLFYKTITNSGLPYNSIMFYFKASEISRTDFYIFTIKGKAIYKGQVFYFEKEVKTERKVEYQPYRMMT